MNLITLDLRECDIMIVIPLYFHEYALLIVNMLFYQKPDDSSRNSMKQTQSFRRNMMMTQT